MSEVRAPDLPREGVTPDRLDRPFLDPLFDRLFPRVASGVHWGLERVRAALSALGDPHLRAPSIHVGGTNGKGSVASTIDSVLRERGLRTGLYTSPHLCSLTERFQVAGRPVSVERLVDAADRIRGVIEEEGLTFFEAATVLAFHLFEEEGVEALVVEVGLGGRLDATNVLRPEVCALTNVAMDHSDFLGEDLTSIAREKAGILKPGIPAVTAETGREALAVFRETAARVGAPLSFLDPVREIGEVEIAEDHTAFDLETGPWGRIRIRTPLVGFHQAANAALAVRALAMLHEGLRPTAEQLLRGIAGVRWPGRDQIRHLGPVTWLFDVAHNTAGVTSLGRVVDTLDLPHPRVALIGVLGDKEWDEMLPPLLDRVDAAVLTQPPSAPIARRWDPGEAAAHARRYLGAAGSGRGEAVDVDVDFGHALARARHRAGSGTVIVTGSCHTVGDALRHLDVDPFPRG